MSWTVRQGDVLERLREMPDESVQCAVTSPPYWGLRDYGTAAWEGGGTNCEHRPDQRPRSERPMGLLQANKRSPVQSAGTVATIDAATPPFRFACGKCGARRIDAQIGLEPTPEAYVAKLVEVFREVRRVLRDDGSVWLNLGDSYSGGGPHHGDNNLGKSGTNRGSITGIDRYLTGLKPKDLVGIPWRVAFALQADGWYLRSDIIWAKPNPMPESVTDRPTKSHEYVFLLTKASRYYFDQEAVREPHSRDWQDEFADGKQAKNWMDRGWAHKTANQNTTQFKTNTMNPAGRNIRSVWSIATQPFPEAHFATFPEALVEPCIKAGSRQDDAILDPFAGSGTVGVVALKLGRSFIGVELNPTYAEMARRRVGNTAPLLAEEVA